MFRYGLRSDQTVSGAPNSQKPLARHNAKIDVASSQRVVSAAAQLPKRVTENELRRSRLRQAT